MVEIWKKIEQYEEYEISTHGRVRSFKNGVELVMSQSVHYKGYRTLYLYKEGIRKKFFIHRLVAVAFIPNPEDKPIVNHKDLDKGNNLLANLEWVDESQNQMHWRELVETISDEDF